MVYGLYRALPGETWLVCHRCRADTSAQLDTSQLGRQDHTPLPSASACVRLSQPPRPPHPPARFVTCATPLVSAKSARMGERAVLAKPPVAGTEPVTPQRRQSLKIRARDSSGVFLNPNS